MMHRALGAVALLLGIAAAWLSAASPTPPIMTALDLGARIMAHTPGLRVIDLRPRHDYDDDHIPTAESIVPAALATAHFDPRDVIVLYAANRGDAVQAWRAFTAAGHAHVYIVDGGVAEWSDQVMAPIAATDVSRYFGGVPRASGAAALRRRGGC